MCVYQTNIAKEWLIFLFFSIMQTMGMILAGAKNNTNQQIKEVLQVPRLPDIFIHQLIG